MKPQAFLATRTHSGLIFTVLGLGGLRRHFPRCYLDGRGRCVLVRCLDIPRPTRLPFQVSHTMHRAVGLPGWLHRFTLVWLCVLNPQQLSESPSSISRFSEDEKWTHKRWGRRGLPWFARHQVAQASLCGTTSGENPMLGRDLSSQKKLYNDVTSHFPYMLSLPSDINTKSGKGDPCCCIPGKRCRQHLFSFYASHFLLHISQKTKNLQYLSPGEKKEPKGVTRKATVRWQYFLLNSPCVLESTPSSFGAGLHLSLPPQLHWRLKCILKM